MESCPESKQCPPEKPKVLGKASISSCSLLPVVTIKINVQGQVDRGEIIKRPRVDRELSCSKELQCLIENWKMLGKASISSCSPLSVVTLNINVQGQVER